MTAERRPPRTEIRPRRTVRPSSGTARGQTQIDFAVGAGVFLLALAFVIAFVPTLFEPFSTAQSAAPIVSDRAAATVVDLLGATDAGTGTIHASTAPGVLSPACTVAFFEANSTLANEAGCPFDAETASEELLGVEDDVQVVIHELNESAPAIDGDPPAYDVVTEHGSFDAVETSRASADPSTATDDVAVSRRVVSVNDAQYRLTVRVW